MAMNKGLKIAIGFATIGVVGVGIYFLYTKLIKPKMDKKKDEETKDESEVSTNIEKYKPPRKSSSSSSSSGTSVPFNNKTEGNHFRNWVNDNHSAYAKKIKLDRDGSYNNAYIKKAWKEYGTSYQKSITDAKALAEKVAKKIKVNDWVMTDNNKGSLNSKKQQTYSRPTMVSADYKGRLYGVPNNVKYKVKRIARDGTNGKKIAFIFNEYDKPTKAWSQGRGFQVYLDYLKKVEFKDFDGGDEYGL